MTTQRAYTLRLRGTDPKDTSWRDTLWTTHEAVNRGAKVFGDWLMTLRGGLDHRLADEGPAEQLKERRTLLALSWLGVEDIHGAPAKFAIEKPAEALRAILAARGLNESAIQLWMADCSASLSASIRNDATWVNRSAAFDEAANQCPSLTRSEIWDFLAPFFVSPQSYLLPEKSAGDADGVEESEIKEEKAKDLVQKAGGWLSKRMGSGAGADFSSMSQAYKQIAAWATTIQHGSSGILMLAELARSLKSFALDSEDADGVLSVISGPGYKSATRNQIKTIASRLAVSREDLDKLAEWASADSVASASKIGGKGPRPYSDMIVKAVEKACGFTYLQTDGAARHCEFSVMLDHAARRVNVNHSWIKNAEAERRQFEEDAQELHALRAKSPDAVAWLEAHCASRKDSSGALEAYRIRKRAIDGWELLIQRWSRINGMTRKELEEYASRISAERVDGSSRSIAERARIAIARELQDDPEIDKLGDIQLFEALADDRAECVWKSGVTPSAQPLKDFVFATDAMAKQIRFKVPAFRHPDPLRHPVFTDFGNSRWDIRFAIHERLKSVADGKRARKEDANWLSQRNAIRMELWSGKTVEPTDLIWSSKRLASDLSINTLQNGTETLPIEVSRADRLGRAAAGADQNARVTITGLFNEKDWNGRLQAPRAQLDAIADHVYGTNKRAARGWNAKAQTMVKRIRWLLSFSAKLTPKGPWIGYCKQFPDDAPAKPFVSKKGEYAVKHRDNDARSGHAKLILSRLPGLRVLSVDLGHRYAAACAVWECLNKRQIEDECRMAGAKAPDANAMFLHLKHNDRTIIYRRIGADMLADGEAHPAPWARLDRQFLIKLQGEDQSPRKARPHEISAVEDFERSIGRLPPEKRPLSVSELMSSAVQTVRLALRRHADCARIAHNLTRKDLSLPGGRVEELTDATRVGLLTDTLQLWYDLACGDRWADPHARLLWDKHIGEELHGPKLPEQVDKDESSHARKQRQEKLRTEFKPVAELLAKRDRMKLHVAWATHWRAENGEPARTHHEIDADGRNTGQTIVDSPATGWHARLQWLNNWILPRFSRRNDRAIRNVGGLSLDRIATIKSLYQVQKAFFTRLTPEGRQMVLDSNGKPTSKPVTADKGFGRSVLEAMERMRENRVKQLASRIAAAALGLGIDLKPHPDDPRFAMCNAVIIENLTRYRPEETRTRRENRQLMSWSSSKVKKYLDEACQLNGLHLREVSAGYTSRQDSRTGSPGMRCSDVPVRKFLTSPWWRKLVDAAKKSINEKGNTGDQFEQILRALDKHWSDRWPKMTEAEREASRPVRLPDKSGELFVSANHGSPAAKGLQADLNAAANIGLKAILDPDWPGKWWYIPCTASRIPLEKSTKGSAVVDSKQPLPPIPASNGAVDKPVKSPGRKNKSRGSDEVANLWSDVSAQLPNVREWKTYAEYQKLVRDRVIELLWKHNQL